MIKGNRLPLLMRWKKWWPFLPSTTSFSGLRPFPPCSYLHMFCFIQTELPILPAHLVLSNLQAFVHANAFLLGSSAARQLQPNTTIGGPPSRKSSFSHSRQGWVFLLCASPRAFIMFYKCVLLDHLPYKTIWCLKANLVSRCILDT